MVSPGQCPLKAGSLVLSRPWSNILWCWRARQWPGVIWFIWLIWQSFIAVIFSLWLLGPCNSLGISHILQYIDDDQFCHTWFGYIYDNLLYQEICPGLLETAIILHPRMPGVPAGAIKFHRGKRPFASAKPLKWREFLRTPFVRYFSGTTLVTSLSPKLARSNGFGNYESDDTGCFANASEVVACYWSESTHNVDFHRELRVNRGGLFPVDFLRSNRFMRCPTSLYVPISLNADLQRAISKWIDARDSIPPGTTQIIRQPTLKIFGPFPSHYFAVVRDSFARARISALETESQTLFKPQTFEVVSKTSEVVSKRADDSKGSPIASAVPSADAKSDPMVEKDATTEDERGRDNEKWTVELVPKIVHCRGSHNLCLLVKCEALGSFASTLEPIIPRPLQFDQSVSRGPADRIDVANIDTTTSNRMPPIAPQDATLYILAPSPR